MAMHCCTFVHYTSTNFHFEAALAARARDLPFLQERRSDVVRVVAWPWLGLGDFRQCRRFRKGSLVEVHESRSREVGSDAISDTQTGNGKPQKLSENLCRKTLIPKQ